MRQLLVSLLIFAAFLVVAGITGFLLFIDTGQTDRLEYLYTVGRVTTFKFAGMPKLNEAETRYLYTSTCTRRCHGSDVVERAEHTPREWESTVKRMRLVNGVSLTDNSEAAILRYLQKNYSGNVPTILSHAANRFLKQHLWKSDFGESDLYVDVIFMPLEYFKLTGNIAEAEEYGVDDYSLFLVYLNTHQEKLPRVSMDKLAVLKDGGGRIHEPVEWKVIYGSSDLHHLEGILKFRKLKTERGTMELALRDLPGQRERLFIWELPIPVFDGEGE